MREILVVGSVAFDSIETAEGSVDRALGGSATYFSAAAQLFGPVRLVGVVGDDFGPEELRFFRERNVDTEGLMRESGKTFLWKGRYETGFAGRTTLATHLNVFESFRPRLPDPYRDSPVVFLANIGPELQLEVLDQVRSPWLLAMDTMDLWIETARGKLEEVLRRVQILLINDEEARQLTGEWSLHAAAGAIRGMGPETVIIKKGEHGVYLEREGLALALPAFPTPGVIDPTGAGDTFAGGFLGSLSLSESEGIDADDMKRAMAAGTVLASFCVEGFGTESLARVDLGRFRERFRDFREMLRLEDLPT